MAASRTDSAVASFTTGLVDRINVFFSVRRYVKMVSRRWPILAVSTVVGVGIATYRAMHSPNIYSASSKIGIAPRIQTAHTSQAQYLEELNNFYDTQLQYMTSSKVMARVESKMRETRPSARDFFLGTKAVKGPGSFSLVVESTDFNYATLYAQAWAREFIAFKNELRENAIGRTAASTRDEITRYEKNLEKARAALLDFQRQHNIGSLKEAGDAAQQRLDKLEAEYQDVKTLRQRLEAKTPEEIASGEAGEAFRAGTGKPATNPVPGDRPGGADPLARFEGASKYGDLKLQLKTQQAEWDRLSAVLKPRHPYMRKVQQELQQVSLELQNQLDLIEEKRRARIKSLHADEESYRPLIEDLRKQVLASRNVQYEFERLKEEEANVKNLLANLRKVEESLNSTTSDEGLFNIIEEGIGSPVPVRPDRRRMILAGLILGLAIGVGLVYLLGRLDDRLELAEDIEAELEAPVLGQVPELDRKKLKQDRPLITELDQHDLFAESLRGLRSAIILGSQGVRRQTLLMTSAVPSDGKTTCTVNFAATLATAGHKVLLVDADLRRGDTHNFFNCSREPGFAEVLGGQMHWSDVLRTTKLNALQVIHSGKLPHNPGELLIGPIVREFLDEARAAYDYVVFDCPPLTGIDDTFALVGLADGLIFVVRSGRTSMRFAKNALATLHQRNVPILGLLLNGITPDNPYYYYNSYYHSYYNQSETQRPGAPLSPALATKMAAPRVRQAAPATPALPTPLPAGPAADSIIPIGPLQEQSMTNPTEEAHPNSASA